MIAITHPIKQMINSQYSFLSSMLNHFPGLLNEWMDKQKKEVEKFAKENSEGDYEVYRSIYNSEISRIDPCYEEELLFNQAMLIMVYSYYESILRRLAKECKAKSNQPSAIAEVFKVKLDREYFQITTFLYETIRPLRDEICHNNNGTLFSRKSNNELIINKLILKKYISVDDGRICILSRDFIKETLDVEYKLLCKLAVVCGYKTVHYGYKEGKNTILSK